MIVLKGTTTINQWNKVPPAVKQFILRAVIILIAWKILYLVFLLPTRVLDKPLSHAVSGGTTWMLNEYTHSADFYSKSETGTDDFDNGPVVVPLENIYYHNSVVVSIEDGCNALELFILYAGFIICMPALLFRKILFIAGGTVLIFLVNVFRCAAVAYIILHYPKYADFAHHYVFTFVVYGFIIALWLIFAKKLTIANAKTA